MIKRMLAMLLAVLMVLSLVGCGEQGGDSAEDENALTEEELQALKDEKDIYVLRETISSLEDFERYLREMNFPKGGEYSSAEQLLEHGRSGQPYAYCQMLTTVLEDDYPEVGIIDVFKEGVNHVAYAYIKEGDTYYALDPFFALNMRINIQSTDLDELATKCMEKSQGYGALDQYTITRICQLEGEAPNGEKLLVATDYGVDTMKYAGTTIPVGLGLPKLTDEEIDALLEENDPHKVKETISTLADFANYCYRGKFIYGDGSIYYVADDGFFWHATCSGYQTLQRRMGGCGTMSSCLHYVLSDDYDEVGYVSMDGHLLAYILSDGLYYLVDPVKYAFSVTDKGDMTWGERWLIHLPQKNVVYCSSDFQEIADSLYGKMFVTEIKYIYTYVSPGDMVFIDRNKYPVGTTATCWYGEPVQYRLVTEHDWVSQENVVDDVCIVMNMPRDGEIFTYGGYHEDPYTKEKTWNTIEDVPPYTRGDDPVVMAYLKEIGAIN